MHIKRIELTVRLLFTKMHYSLCTMWSSSFSNCSNVVHLGVPDFNNKEHILSNHVKKNNKNNKYKQQLHTTAAPTTSCAGVQLAFFALWTSFQFKKEPEQARKFILYAVRTNAKKKAMATHTCDEIKNKNNKNRQTTETTPVRCHNATLFRDRQERKSECSELHFVNIFRYENQSFVSCGVWCVVCLHFCCFCFVFCR